MSEGLAALTDKEKEALRLLLLGHDAKSSAAELDISVHTINDRLRNARRKLNVSSSREAARILGNAEGQTPQNVARTSFGIASKQATSDTAGLNTTPPRRLFGLTWLAGGMLIMSLVIAAAVIGIVHFSGAETAKVEPASVGTEEAATETPESLAPAERFLAFVDAGDWQGSWNATGPFFQSQVSASGWATQVEPVRKPLGAVNERRMATVERASTLPGAPEGEYEVLQFHTDFAKIDGLATETVVMLQGENGWEVVGYFVRPGA